MKLIQLVLASIICLSSFSKNKEQEWFIIVKGKIFKWQPDSVYLQTISFYSPFSSEINLNR
jgi:hypothetical protein